MELQAPSQELTEIVGQYRDYVFVFTFIDFSAEFDSFGLFMETPLISLTSYPILWYLWLFHHLLCWLSLHGPLLWCLFFLEFVFNLLCFPLRSLTLNELICSDGFNYRLHADGCQIHISSEITSPIAHRTSPSGGPHLCFESTGSQLSSPTITTTTTKIASFISIPWYTATVKGLTFCLVPQSKNLWVRHSWRFHTVPIQSFPF